MELFRSGSARAPGLNNSIVSLQFFVAGSHLFVVYISRLEQNAPVISEAFEHSSSCEAVSDGYFRSFLNEIHLYTLSAVDYAVKIRVNPQQTGVDLNVKHSMVRASFVPQNF